MNLTAFIEIRFWLLVALSLVAPVALYWVMLKLRTASRAMVVAFGVALVVLAGIDVYLLQSLSAIAKLTPSLVDDAVFTSELTLGLYVLPALFAGIGVNILSSVVIRHLEAAEDKFEREHPDA